MVYRKRLKLIACEVLFREICCCAAGCSNIVDITFMEKGLHDVGAKTMLEAAGINPEFWPLLPRNLSALLKNTPARL
jgi:hypothetical protein